MRRFFNFLFIASLLTLCSLWSWGQVSTQDTDPLLAQLTVVPYEWNPGQGGDLKISMTLPEDFHAYEDQFKIRILEPEGFKVAPFKIEPTVKWFDKFSKKERSGIREKATLTAHIEAPLRFLKKYEKMKLELTYQACSSQYCLFPIGKILEVPIITTSVEGEAQITSTENIGTSPSLGFFESQNFEKYMGRGIFAGLFFVFLAGIFTSFTPCIFPMIPITLAVLGNHSEKRSRAQNFITSCIYVLGIASTYSILGLAAALSGGLFGATLGNPIVLAIICIIFLTMALSMYGLFEIQVPASIRNKLGSGKSKQGVVGTFVTGLFAGIVASPCVGPVLVAILTYVASTQNALLGFLYLFTYALGLGLIFIALGLSNQLIKLLPRSGAWMNGFKFILGSLMLSAFYYYLSLLLPQRYFDFSLGAGLVIVASVYGAFLPTSGKVFNHIRKGLMLAVLFVGIGHILIASFDLRPYIRASMTSSDSLNVIQAMEWQPYTDDLLKQAIAMQKPVIIDYWAEWCAACHELKNHTFTDIRVRSMASKFELLQFDVTKDSEQLRALKKKYNIQGLPTVIFINPHGVWIDALTLTQFEQPDKFLKRMEKAAQ